MNSLSYISTRGLAPALDLRGATMAGLAVDGGLYVPAAWPSFSASDIAAMKGKPYAEIAQRVLSPFVEGVIAPQDLRRLIDTAYASFADPSVVAPLKQLDDKLWILELFHGPTLAFKDVALQLLGGMFEHFLSASGERMTVIGATSGDTGSAAMAALAGRRNVDVFILYPDKGPSEIQRKQMTCMEAPNVHAMAVEGSFDDCQATVKALFNDQALRAKYKFAAVNSINLMRILAQVVYYFAAVSAFEGKQVSFVVPSGNFGNVFAGYAAKRCGVPIAKLAVASNSNDILTRFFASGRMKGEGVHATLSPSMDIQISSNFERLLFDLCGRDAASLRAMMEAQKSCGTFEVTLEQLATARQTFTAACADDELTLKTIADVHKQCGMILDPHTAVGVAAARQLASELPEPVVCLATAHPAKFPDTVRKAIGTAPALPPFVEAQMSRPERTALLPPTAEAVMGYIAPKVKV
ncbi:MAG: threonine synthase [Bdellovibrionales bacterium]